MCEIEQVDSQSDRAFWESNASAWLERWCVDGGDPWGTEFNLPALLDLVPDPAGLTLDVGCGEGRVARQLESIGHLVIGSDGSRTLAAEASRQRLAVALGDGAALPFRDGCASITISSMVLMDVDDLIGHLGELARVTRPGGWLCASILHPIRMAGFPLGDEFDTFAMGDYLHPKLQDWRFDKGGAPARLRFWQRPVSDYLNAVTDAGFVVDIVSEPRPSAEFIETHDAAIWDRVPMFLQLRATRKV